MRFRKGLGQIRSMTHGACHMRGKRDIGGQCGLAGSVTFGVNVPLLHSFHFF